MQLLDAHSPDPIPTDPERAIRQAAAWYGPQIRDLPTKRLRTEALDQLEAAEGRTVRNETEAWLKADNETTGGNRGR